MAEEMYVAGSLRLSDRALFNLLDNPKGDVGRYMRKLGLQILAGSKAMVGVRTGNLKRSLSLRQGIRGRVQYVEVGSNVRHAYWHHEGTKPHEIRGHEGRIMRFNVGGRVVYARKVSHPGTKPRKYLTIPMRRVVK